ncbi:MAG: hypothetical protein JW776_06170 [Candidatus Lokiarchaeota archaeon]|nr:hypothetical protein [Candidatus Lokiarchaeota archaeon]
MPSGCFLIEIDPKGSSSLIGSYFDNEDESIEIDDSLILQLQMGLMDKKLFVLTKSEYHLVSYIENYMKDRKRYKLITTAVLKSSDSPENFREGVKLVSDIFTQDPDMSKAELENKLSDVYYDYFEIPTIALNKRELEARLAKRVKDLNKKMKFDEAKKLLEIVKKVPRKLYQANRNAERAMKAESYDRAEREYIRAMKFAEQLQENDLAKEFFDKAKRMSSVPVLRQQRDKIVDKARNALRNDKLDEAYKLYREAASVSRKLYDSLAAEEFELKSDALAKFHEVHEKFHKKN